MMNIRQRTVNVKRSELLQKLKENLNIHRKDFQEAVVGYKIKLIKDLESKLAEVNSTEPLKLSKISSVSFGFPPNHEQEYVDIIEMLEMSVDDVINLDSESFKAYVKNEWSWSKSFDVTATMYKSFVS